MGLLVLLLLFALQVYFWIIIASVVVSWLVVFGVLNTRNKWVYKFLKLLERATEPLYKRLRQVLPPIGGIDLTPMVVIFGIILLQKALVNVANSYTLAGGY